MEKLKFVDKSKAKSSVYLAKFIGYKWNTTINQMANRDAEKYMLLKVGFEKICNTPHKTVAKKLNEFYKFYDDETTATLNYILTVGSDEVRKRLINGATKLEIFNSYRSEVGKKESL